MKKGLMLPVMLMIVVSLGLAPPVQADLVSLTLILVAVWTSGVVVNETAISDDKQPGQEAARTNLGDSRLAVAQTPSD